MPHRLYQVEGLILARHDYGEADALFRVLTPDFGLIGISARGVRHLGSKLRPQLRVLGHARFTLVRGRELWRLTNAEASGELALLLGNQNTRQSWARIADLVSRLVRGEGAQAILFYDLLAGLRALGSVGADQVADCEAVIVLRLLRELGYVRERADVAPWLAAGVWPADYPTLAPQSRVAVIAAINHGLSHSQL